MRRCGCGYGREDHATYGKEGNRTQIEAKFPPTHRNRSPIDKGRQDEEQHKLWREPNCRQARDNRQNEAGQDQENRGRNVPPLRHDPNCGDCDEQK
jgi:hypothetical protein